MNSTIRQYVARSARQLDANIFGPLTAIVTLIAIVSAVQSYFLFFKGAHTVSSFLLVLISKTIYCWYYVPLAYAVLILTRGLMRSGRRTVTWIGVHLSGLLVGVVIHQIIAYGLEMLIGGTGQHPSLVNLLLINLYAWIDVVVYILLLLGFCLMEYRRITQEKDLECMQLESQLVQVQLQELRSKINPQFLFQTLETITHFVREHRNTDANRILALLSDFLRTTVYNADKVEISLEDELQFLGQYFEIENFRSEQQFHLMMQIDSNALQTPVPNCVLQPIAKDIVSRHSASHKRIHDIVVTARTNDAFLSLSIEDRRGGAEGSVGEEMSALPLIRERLVQLYGQEMSLLLEGLSGGGIVVTMRLPLDRTASVSSPTVLAEART